MPMSAVTTSKGVPTFSAPLFPVSEAPQGASRIKSRERCTMKITELLLAELDREAVGIRKTLERVPEGKNDWKPHEKSMPLGYLATIVANIPAWLDRVVNMDELDINPPGGSKFRPPEWKTRRDLLEQFEASLRRDARSCRRPLTIA